MNRKRPVWKIPSDLSEKIASDSDLIWEDDSWHPILLTVMDGTEYEGRDIPRAWQLEFEPSLEDFQRSNQEITKIGLDPDGYGWATLIQSVVGKYHPDICEELHFGDTEESSCVIWVEDEKTCKLLLEIIWELIYASN